MKKALLLVVPLIMLTSCSKLEQELKHTQSDYSGLQRSITLYSETGEVIKQWEGRYRVQIEGAYASFIDKGKNVKISGTVVIQEI